MLRRMKSFEIDGESPAVFVARVTDALRGRALGSIASFTVDGDDVVLTFDRLGKSEVRFATSAMGRGFRATRASEKIALAHRPFREEMEKKLGKVVAAAGARVVG